MPFSHFRLTPNEQVTSDRNGLCTVSLNQSWFAQGQWGRTEAPCPVRCGIHQGTAGNVWQRRTPIIQRLALVSTLPHGYKLPHCILVSAVVADYLKEEIIKRSPLELRALMKQF